MPVLMYRPFFLLLVAALFTLGCQKSNLNLAKLSFFEARSDKIPGLITPQERIRLIAEKGKNGAAAKDHEKDILVAQLIVEYRTSLDPNVRRASVDALAKIPYPKRDEYMKEILKDNDPFVRISALEAIAETFSGPASEQIELIVDRLKIDADKDVRLSAARMLGHVGKKMLKVKGVLNRDESKMIVIALGDALHDKESSVRYQAMHSLQDATGKDYGIDINRWAQYVQYEKGEATEVPKERSFAEKIPRPQIPMLK